MTEVMTADDFRYLGKLLDWCAGQGMCQIDGLPSDPEEFACDLWDKIGTGPDDYSADALAGAIARQATASSLAAENERLKLDLQAAACLQVSQYRAGLKAGWNLCCADDDQGFQAAMGGTEHIAELKRINSARAALQGE